MKLALVTLATAGAPYPGSDTVLVAVTPPVWLVPTDMPAEDSGPPVGGAADCAGGVCDLGCAVDAAGFGLHAGRARLDRGLGDDGDGAVAGHGADLEPVAPVRRMDMVASTVSAAALVSALTRGGPPRRSAMSVREVVCLAPLAGGP